MFTIHFPPCSSCCETCRSEARPVSKANNPSVPAIPFLPDLEVVMTQNSPMFVIRHTSDTTSPTELGRLSQSFRPRLASSERVVVELSDDVLCVGYSFDSVANTAGALHRGTYAPQPLPPLN